MVDGLSSGRCQGRTYVIRILWNVQTYGNQFDWNVQPITEEWFSEGSPTFVRLNWKLSSCNSLTRDCGEKTFLERPFFFLRLPLRRLGRLWLIELLSNTTDINVCDADIWRVDDINVIDAMKMRATNCNGNTEERQDFSTRWLDLIVNSRLIIFNESTMLRNDSSPCPGI